MRLFRLFGGRAEKPACFPDQRVGYAIGDIHGRADLLKLMLDKLEAQAGADRKGPDRPIVVFLGDYVDRGPESREVIDMLIYDRPRGFERRFLRGNHEQAMLAFMDTPRANVGWLRHGGAATLQSYGVQPPPLAGAADADWSAAAEALRANLPAAHLDFLINLERYVVLGDYAFVHAGVRPGRPLEKQTDADLFWIRERFHSSQRRFSHRVVHGHTPLAEPYSDARRIGVDTGAYASGVLTAVRLEADGAEFVSVTGAASA